MSVRYHRGTEPLWTTLVLLMAFISPAARAADKNKPEKVEPWVQIRTPHFVVASDGGEKTARRVADQFETVRRVLQATMPNAHLDRGIPIQILAARDNKSFAALFPENPMDKRAIPPAGMFIPGPEKIYIVLRTNAFGQVPYEDVYQGYARMVLKMTYRNLPPWLEEGYANVYGSLKISEKGASFDKPEPEDMSVLWESPLLPLDIVLHADRNSGYYTSGSKTTVYFAESRALVHFLLTDSQSAGAHLLDRYVALVENGADSLQTARQVFGDLNQLQSRFDAYLKQSTTTPTEIANSGGSDDASSAHTLSAAETAAMLGGFALIRGRRDDARTKLENAITLDPSLASAEESMGFLLLQLEQDEDADKHFTRAEELDPKDSLAFYGQGMVAMSRGGFVGVPVGAVMAFEKTVALNPDFAPAWFNLASIYALRKDTLPKALAAAQRAAALVPGDAGYQYQVALILEDMGRTEDARKAAEQVRASATDSRMADKAGDLIAQMSQPQRSAPSVASGSGGTNSASSPDRTVHIERKTEPDDKPAITPRSSPTESNAAAPPPPPLPTPATAPAETRVYSMVGTITDVSCAESPQIQITLKAQTIVMRLHAADAAQMAIKSSGSAPLAKNMACTGLRGRSARISYLLVADQKWDGEIQTVELRSSP